MCYALLKIGGEKMSKKIITQDSIVCSNNDTVFNYYGWPSVTQLPDGNLAVAASGFRVDHVCPFGKAIICYSMDEGKTWTGPSVVIDTPLDDRDAGIVVFGDNKNKVIFTSFNNRLSFQRECLDRRPDHPRHDLIDSYLRSIEHEADALEEKYYGSTYKISNDGGYTFGELKRIKVTAPHGPCVMRDNTLLYIGRRFHAEEDGVTDRLECYKQNEQGEFEYLSYIENISVEGGSLLSCEPHSIVLPDGKIIVLIRVQGLINAQRVFTIYQSESYDDGHTFTKPHPVGLEHGSPPHIMRHSSGVLIASYGYRLPPYGQRVMFSVDNGETWDVDYILRDDGPSSDLGYPATVELKDGSLLTVYYQQEKGRDNCVIMQSIWELPEGLI
jgi:sialidase-1